MSRGGESGFTLIEVVVALVLLLLAGALAVWLGRGNRAT